jgi:hypothetical protein
MLHSSFPRQRVVIIGEGAQFDESVTQLLINKTNMIVAHATDADKEALLNNIKLHRPNVILVCESESLSAAHILDLFSSNPVGTGLRVIIVRLPNKVIDIYPKLNFVEGKMSEKPCQILTRKDDDLLSACFI